MWIHCRQRSGSDTIWDLVISRQPCYGPYQDFGGIYNWRNRGDFNTVGS